MTGSSPNRTFRNPSWGTCAPTTTRHTVRGTDRINPIGPQIGGDFHQLVSGEPATVSQNAGKNRNHQQDPDNARNLYAFEQSHQGSQKKSKKNRQRQRQNDNFGQIQHGNCRRRHQQGEQPGKLPG